jgi:hypothetical protein
MKKETCSNQNTSYNDKKECKVIPLSWKKYNGEIKIKNKLMK